MQKRTYFGDFVRSFKFTFPKRLLTDNNRKFIECSNCNEKLIGTMCENHFNKIFRSVKVTMIYEYYCINLFTIVGWNIISTAQVSTECLTYLVPLVSFCTPSKIRKVWSKWRNKHIFKKYLDALDVFYITKVHKHRFENLPLRSSSYKNNTLKIPHS